MVKIAVNTPTERNAKFVKICAKCSDMCSVDLLDSDGGLIAQQEDGYVPGFMPGGDGDYVELTIDLDTGQIMNWVPSSRKVEEWVNRVTD